MKSWLLCFVVMWLVAPGGLRAEESAPDGVAEAQHVIPGVALAEGISQITGTAVSPLLGMGAVGAWKYWQTPEVERHRLPWYCHPWVWGTCAVVVGLCLVKDVLGAAAPALVKKPLDFVELFEDKLSALVVSSAFVPLVVGTMARMEQVPGGKTAALQAELGVAAMPVLAVLDGYWVKFALLLPLCLGVFFVVWLACHAINVLIALSPFGVVDVVLKLTKAALLGVITVAAMLSPWLGLLVCVPVIVVAFLISGWTFRLSVFGTLFGLDVLSRRKAGSEELRDGVWGFNARRMEDVPVRSFGKLWRGEDGRVVFRQRPWLVLRAREMVVEGADGLSQGMLYSSLTKSQQDSRVRTEFVLLPRYRDCSLHVALRLGIDQARVSESVLRKGYRTLKQWLVEMFTGRPPLADYR